MAELRSIARVVAWMLAGGMLLVTVRPPAALHAQWFGVREVHLVRQPGNEEQPFAFRPAELTVLPGTTVRWVNDADVFHTVTFAQSTVVRLPSGVFDATLGMVEETVAFRFDAPGVYAYYCEPHVEFMAGIVRVTAAAPGGGQAAAGFPPTGTGGPASFAVDAPVREAAAPLAVVAVVAVLLALTVVQRARADSAGTAFSLVNASPVELHELVAIRIADRETRSVAELVQLPDEATAGVIAEMPAMVLIAPPRAEGFAVLGDGRFTEPGRYALVCFIPTGADPQAYLAAAAMESEGPPQVAGGPPHALLGMIAEVVVE